MSIPYTTAELLQLLGVFRTYPQAVIFRPRVDGSAHPLKAAYLGRGMWDRERVDYFLAHREELDGRRKEKTA